MRKQTKHRPLIEDARKEIRANIRKKFNTLNEPVLRSESRKVFIATLENQLKDPLHPLNKLFELARLDKEDHDHWRILASLMAEEIFGLRRRGAPPKERGPVKHLELLFRLNVLHHWRSEDGLQSDLAEVLMDFPTYLKVLSEDPANADFVARYGEVKSETLKRYAHVGLTKAEALMEQRSADIHPDLLSILQEALDNFRPDWRQGQPK